MTDEGWWGSWLRPVQQQRRERPLYLRKINAIQSSNQKKEMTPLLSFFPFLFFPSLSVQQQKKREVLPWENQCHPVKQAKKREMTPLLYFFPSLSVQQQKEREVLPWKNRCHLHKMY